MRQDLNTDSAPVRGNPIPGSSKVMPMWRLSHPCATKKPRDGVAGLPGNPVLDARDDQRRRFLPAFLAAFLGFALAFLAAFFGAFLAAFLGAFLAGFFAAF